MYSRANTVGMVRVDHFGDPEHKGGSPLGQGTGGEGHCSEPQRGEQEGLTGGGKEDKEKGKQGGGELVGKVAIAEMKQG